MVGDTRKIGVLVVPAIGNQQFKKTPSLILHLTFLKENRVQVVNIHFKWPLSTVCHFLE